MRSQRVVSDYFAKNGWPFAESTGAGRSGSDVTGMPGLSVEVKARRAFSPMAWVKQAHSENRGGLPFVVMRPDGMGETTVHLWPVMLTLEDFTELLHSAGYGSRQVAEDAPQDAQGEVAHADEDDGHQAEVDDAADGAEEPIDDADRSRSRQGLHVQQDRR